MKKRLQFVMADRYYKILIFILMICIGLHAQGKNSIATVVNLSFKDVPLKEVFSSLSIQTGFVFTYSNEQIDENRVVSINVSHSTLTAVLEKIFEGSLYSWCLREKFVVLTCLPSESSSFKRIDTLLTISGKIVDKDGKPIPAATISVKNTMQGTISNERGEFSLPGISPKSKLQISSIGFVSQDFIVGSKWKWQSFVLEENVRTLDEMVVSTYLPISKRFSLGGISTISAKQIENKPVTNPLLALQAEVPGVVINQNSGLANSGITVQIRGQNSFRNGTDPLYVIDGVPYQSQMIQLLNGANGQSGPLSSSSATPGNPLSFINPNDIESISVLKDADATSIYGSRAAAGAILITTKRGRPGATSININYQKGIGNVSKFLDVLNTKEYLQMRHLAKANDQADILPSDYDLNGTWDTAKSTNWQKELLGRTAKFTNIQSSISGGSENLQFLVGLGYHKETTVYPTSLGDQKGSIHINLNNLSTNKKFRIQLTGNFLLDDNRLPVSDIIKNAIYLPPVAPALKNSDGSLNWGVNEDSVSTFQNPLAVFNSKAKVKTANMISNLSVQYELFTGLVLKSNFGFTNMQIDEYQTYPLTIYSPEIRKYLTRQAYYGTGNTHSWIIEPQLSYKVTLHKSRIETLIGASLQEKRDNKVNLAGDKYSSDLLLEDIKSAGTLTAISTIDTKYKYNAVFGIINYRLLDRYIINLSARRDGSSRFGPENLFHNFASIAGGWIFSSESWVHNKIPLMSYGKIFASYGTSGNDQIGDYQFRNIYYSNNVPLSYQGVVGLAPVGIPNPYLQWEETRKLQLGLDLGVVNDNLLLTVNYYRNRSSNQLLFYKLPSIAGAASYIRNLPAKIQNMGWEIDFKTINFKKSDFTWTSSFNFTIARNKLISFPGLSSSSYATSYEIGKPMTGGKLYNYHGVDPITGLYDFYNAEGKITSTPGDNDRTVINDMSPTFYAGLGNVILYKNFEVSLLFQLNKQVVSNIAAGLYPGYFGGNIGNQPATVLDGYWKYPGDAASIQKFSTLPQGPSFTLGASTFVYSRIWFIRLKNASLSWKLPKSWLQKAQFKDVSFSINGQNIFLISNYKGIDPESGSSALGPLRVIMGGVNVSF